MIFLYLPKQFHTFQSQRCFKPKLHFEHKLCSPERVAEQMQALKAGRTLEHLPEFAASHAGLLSHELIANFTAYSEESAWLFCLSYQKRHQEITIEETFRLFIL